MNQRVVAIDRVAKLMANWWMVITFVSSVAVAQSVRVSLDQIHGAGQITDHDLRDALGFSSPRIVPNHLLQDSVRRWIDSLRTFYMDHGYYGVRIDSIGLTFNRDSSSAALAVAITEGTRATIDAIQFSGNHALTQMQLRENFSIRSGNVLDRQELDRLIDNILIQYENLGFPFAEISLKDATLSAARGLTLGFEINEGSLVTIRDVVAANKTETTQEVFRRGSGMDLNRPYRQRQVDRVRMNLEKLQIFTSVSEPVLQMRTVHDAVLAVNVEEANTTLIDAIIGYLPANGTSSGYFVGSVDVSFLNLFATARKLGAHWQRKEIGSQDLWVAYREPWVFGLPVAANIRVEQRIQDTLFTRREAELGASVELGEGFTITGTLSTSATDPGSAGSPLQHSSEYDAGIVLQYDTRDDPYCPRHGVLYASRYTAGTKSAASAASIQRVDINAEIDQPLFRESVGVLAVHGAAVSASNIDESDLLRVGGVTSIRGYRDQQYRASSIGWGMLEFRQLLSRRSYLYAFSDAGYFSRVATLTQPLTQKQLLLGYGIGIQTDSQIGLIRVSLALGKDDAISQAKIHFEIVNRF